MTKSEKEQQHGETKKQIVLVVDGKPIRKFYTSIFLQRLNYHIITAKSAEDGLTYLGLTVPLAIIVNIDLPDISGLDFLKKVKKDRRTRSVPVIIYTSNRNAQMKTDCEQAGCSSYLNHPATLEDLYAALQIAIKKPRRFVRLETFLDVAVDDGTRNSQKKSYIVGISELGMFVSTTRNYSYGSVLPFSFCLPNAPGWIIRVEGQIVHTQHSKNKQQGIGVKFLKIGKEEREFIKDFIREKLMEVIA